MLLFAFHLNRGPLFIDLFCYANDKPICTFTAIGLLKVILKFPGKFVLNKGRGLLLMDGFCFSVLGWVFLVVVVFLIQLRRRL